MEINTIVAIALLTSIAVAFLYCLKRILDAETFQRLTGKIVAYIIKAEQDILGHKMGAERLDEVIKNVNETADKTEQRLLRKTNAKALVSNIFTGVVAPILFKRIIR
jgi:hypothetical protein